MTTSDANRDGSVLVTGASRGIGRALALELGTRGYRVVATMRNPDDGASLLAEHAGPGTIRVERLDLTDPSSIAVPDDLAILVNNGAAQDGYLPVEHLPVDDLRAIFETNVFGTFTLMQRAIPVLTSREGSVLCTITSSSIATPVAFMAAYRGSKAALSAISETVRAEITPFGVRVIEIFPGPVDTDGLRNSDIPGAIAYPPYRAAAERMSAHRPAIYAMAVTPAEAARRIVDTIETDDGRYRYGCDPFSDELVARLGENAAPNW